MNQSTTKTLHRALSIGYTLAISAVIVFMVLALAGCGDRKLKPPKKSPCACNYDIYIDMEKNIEIEG